MRAEDGPSCMPREPSIRIVLDRLVTVEFRPSSTRTPASLDGIARRPQLQEHPDSRRRSIDSVLLG